MGNEKIKVLVTGSNGLLGQKITDICLQDETIHLIATGQGVNRYPIKEGYVYESLNIVDESMVRNILEKHQPDAVIHGAAMTNVDACETEKELCTSINVKAVKNLAEICAAQNIHLVHISTDFIFDGNQKMYNEDAKPNPLSFYGNSKLQGENMVMQYAKKWSILRTSLVYGVVTDMSRSNIVLWAYNMLKKQNPAKVVDDQFRTPTLSEDLAIGCILTIKNKAPGIFNICGKDYMGIYDLVEKIARHFDYSMDQVKRVKSDALNQPAQRPPSTGLDISKARRQLGYSPHSFSEGLDIVKAQLSAIEEL